MDCRADVVLGLLHSMHCWLVLHVPFDQRDSDAYATGRALYRALDRRGFSAHAYCLTLVLTPFAQRARLVTTAPLALPPRPVRSHVSHNGHRTFQSVLTHRTRGLGARARDSVRC